MHNSSFILITLLSLTTILQAQRKDGGFELDPSSAKIYAPIQTGRFRQVYWATGHEFVTDTSKDRVDIFAAWFDHPFKEVPHLQVGLSGIVLSHQDAGVYIEAHKATRKGFEVKITCPQGAVCQIIDVDLIAFEDGEALESYNFGPEDFDEETKKSWSQGEGDRFVTKTIESKFENPGAISFIKGFRLIGEQSLRASTNATVDEDDKKVHVTFGTWVDTLAYPFHFGVIVFDKSKNMGNIKAHTSTNGILWAGKGPRFEVFIEKDINGCDK